MNILFIASTATIAPDPAKSHKLYVDALGLPLGSKNDDDYIYSSEIEGSKHFGVWPLSEAAQACFGLPDWPEDRPVPQASVEFEVASEEAVAEAEQELREAGFEILHPTKTEPWGQTITRVQSPEGAIIGVSFAPSMH